ncbi:MAG TPA: hypothetical protein VFS21_27460 [Roseiflexaceae bacterium]|nr:hypothetical protein [Roseiflexaceae bacterium]
MDDSGRLWVADTYNHRVLLFETTPALTNTPTMSPTASSTPTPTPNELLTPFGLVCRTAPGVVTAGGTISLPAGQQAILQSSWTTLHPLDLRTTPAFLPEQSMQDGDSFRISVPWPGVRTNDRLVQVTISLTLLDPTTRRPLPDQSRLLDYYWYPQACDPSTATPTSAPTATPLLTLLQNGGFEPGTLIGWEPTGAVQVRADAAWRGQYGAHLLTGGRLDQVFATTPGQRYYVSARLRLTSEPVAPTWGGMRLQVVNSTWQQLAASPGQSASTQPLGQWYRVDLVFDADQPQSRLIVQNFSNGQIAADLDEVIVSTSPIPPDAALPVPTLATSPTPTATAVAAPPPGALCRLDPGWLTLTSTVALPSGQPALLQTNWRITVPSDRTTEPVYQLHGPVQDGDTITTSVLWPGIRSSDTAVQVVLGTILLDPLTMNPLPGTSTSQSFYWYPWVCPAPTP